MESLKWFFKNRIEAIGEIQPTCVMTDQASIIRIALKDVMPLSIHRWCFMSNHKGDKREV
ncbi:hypothetical protein PHJA_002262800 [Phtheirospermum japonicum]|uniref:MULE transposase domain-containing protein n=1 Tax=Phtheirospermum japonicum TaxID=374723 RepID=A0A830CU76_9LAMI|nr:hypothetical protein PHJA_002262800 [Phtheirospermum japonicum]